MSKKKLTIDEVVEIKRYLMEIDGYTGLNQKQIAKKFEIAGSMISKIKNESKYAEIKLDENGKLISDGINFEPTDFIIPPTKPQNETSKNKTSIQDKSTQFRVRFIENYFKKKTTQSRFNQDETQVIYQPTSNKSIRFIGAIWKKYKSFFHNEWDDFISEIMSITVKATMTYEPDGAFNWSNVLEADTKEYGLINSYINKAIKVDVQKYVNKITDTIQYQQDGAKGYAKPIRKSLDELVEHDGEETAIIQMIHEDSNIWKMNGNYHNSHFLNWFARNKDKLLTTDQLKFLNVMKYFQRDEHDYSLIPYSQIPDEYKPYSESAITHNYRRIRERVNEAYERENVVSIRESQAINEINFWQGLIELIEISDEYITEQNKMITEWIYKYQKSRHVDDLFFHLRQVDILELRKKPEILKGSTLYYIAQLVMDRIEELKNIEFTSVKFYRKPSEYGGLTKEEYRKRENERILEQMKIAKNDKTIRFTALPSGVFIKTN